MTFFIARLTNVAITLGARVTRTDARRKTKRDGPEINHGGDIVPRAGIKRALERIPRAREILPCLSCEIRRLVGCASRLLIDELALAKLTDPCLYEVVYPICRANARR